MRFPHGSWHAALPLALLATALGTRGVGAQDARAEECTSPDGYWLTCALVAGGIGDLRGGMRTRIVREYRLTDNSGPPHAPVELIIVREFADSVRGQLLLLWPGDMKNNSFLTSRCGRTWSNAAGILCEAVVTQPPDWAAILKKLDAAGIREIPSRPHVPVPCVSKTTPGPPGELPRQVICPMMFDGPSYSFQGRHGSVFWTYDFPESWKSESSAELKRDQAVLKVFWEVSGLRAR